MSDDPAPHLPIRDIPPAEPASPPRPRPRLSIAHLMLWTLGTAIVLATSRLQISAFEMPRFSAVGDAATVRMQTFVRLSAIVTAPFTGIAVALLLMTVARRYRRQPLPISEPGHWILLIGGIGVVLSALAELIQFLIMPLLTDLGGFVNLTYTAQFLAAALCLIVGGLYYVAWRRTSGPPRWSFFFASSAAVYSYVVVAGVLIFALMTADFAAWPFLGMIFGLIAIPIYLGWLLSFPYAVLRDLALKEYRDALHWAGIVLVVVTLLQGVAQTIAMSVIR